MEQMENLAPAKVLREEFRACAMWSHASTQWQNNQDPASSNPLSTWLLTPRVSLFLPTYQGMAFVNFT